MAERGKWAEAEVRKELSAISDKVAGFAFNRIPDARGGFMQPADADFQWFFETGHNCLVPALPNAAPESLTVWGASKFQSAPWRRNGVIEVKEVEHEHLLPHKNFGVDKIARVWKRHMAGCESLVLVAHKLKGMTKRDVKWRSVPLAFFRDTQYVKGIGSWDLRAFPYVNMSVVVQGIVR